jgi:hypothetical protein
MSSRDRSWVDPLRTVLVPPYFVVWTFSRLHSLTWAVSVSDTGADIGAGVNADRVMKAEAPSSDSDNKKRRKDLIYVLFIL